MSTARRFQPPSPDAIAQMRAFAERRLSAAEFDAMVRAPMSAEEREDLAGLIRWFRRRYPTPAARLAYARRAYARWKRAMP
jgi:hypothetical protein